jgi:AcrR family transcriptional regulator
VASLPEHLRPSPLGHDLFPREMVAEQQRERVLNAATEIFAKRGYRGTNVEHIVSGARIGVTSFYSLFEGKEDCFLAVYDRIVAEGRERMAAAAGTGAPWSERLVAVLRTLLELIEGMPFAARIALVEVHTAGAAARAHHERDLDYAAALLQGGRKQSPFPDELPATLEFATVGGLAWFLEQRIAQGEAADVTALLPEVLEIVAEPYLGEAGTAGLIDSA